MRDGELCPDTCRETLGIYRHQPCALSMAISLPETLASTFLETSSLLVGWHFGETQPFSAQWGTLISYSESNCSFSSSRTTVLFETSTT